MATTYSVSAFIPADEGMARSMILLRTYSMNSREEAEATQAAVAKAIPSARVRIFKKEEGVLS